MKPQLILFLAIFHFLPSCAQYSASPFRPEPWADPVAIEGVPNLHKVDENLYRSGQPTTLGMKNLERLGIKTVINLRAFNDDDDELKGTTLRKIDIPIHAWLPREKAAKKFVSITSNVEEGPFLVHCYHGSDRTGSMTALYRVSREGWTSDKAIREMLYGGYGFHKIWQPLICWTIEEAQQVAP